MSMSKMVALITGGVGCLGRATAKKLTGEGWNVMVFDLPEAEANAKRLLPKEVKFFGGNITSEEDAANVYKKIEHEYGGLNALVNCAGISNARMVYNANKGHSANLSEFSNLINVNICGTFNMIRLAAPLMAKNEFDEDRLRGVIVNTSGFYAFDGQIGQSGLAAVGGAIASMTLPLCRDLAQVGIRVVTIAPGLMESELLNFIPKKILSHLELFTPNPKRLGQPEEYAKMVKTIIDNKFLNGETIRLDGGLRVYIN